MAGEVALTGIDLPDGFQNTFFENYGVNPFVSAAAEPFSTFAMDVDTASYTITRAWMALYRQITTMAGRCFGLASAARTSPLTTAGKR